jgi:hypothetical protein
VEEVAEDRPHWAAWARLPKVAAVAYQLTALALVAVVAAQVK